MAVGIPTANAAAPDNTPKPYVVVLKQPSGDANAMAKDHSRRFGVKVNRVFGRLGGYAGSMTDQEAARLAQQPGFVVAPDSTVTAFETTQKLITQETPYSFGLPTDWGWGLDRIDQQASRTPNREYHYEKDGTGVTAYVIDTGVRINHIEFQDGSRNRASSAFSSVSDSTPSGQDCNGHGTHVAGILGGKTFGVAKNVNIVSVRVLDCNGSGTISGVIAGIDWVTSHAVKPAVANMSLGGSANSALDTAVRNSIASGITYAIAAGNGNVFGSGVDACSNVSPARVTQALTVGATDTADKRTAWSNYGTCVDVYAPGNNITSSYGVGTDSEYKQLSGTSMATPAAAGVAALILQIAPNNTSTEVPAKVISTLVGLATSGVVTGTNTSGARLLHEPWTTCDMQNTAKLLGTSPTGCTTQQPPPPPPPPPPTTPPTTRPCFIICWR